MDGMRPPAYRRSERVEESPVADRVVLYHCRSGHALVLNPTGRLVWDALASPATAADVAERLRGAFPSVEQGRIEEDVRLCLDQLVAQDVIVSARVAERI